MDSNIYKIVFSLLCLALIMNPILAETPYKIEVQKIPISVYMHNNNARDNFSFELINALDSNIEMTINEKFDETKNQIEGKIIKTETAKIQNIKEEQPKKESFYFAAIITLFFLRGVSVVGFILVAGLICFKDRIREIEKLRNKAKERLDQATKIISRKKGISKLLEKESKGSLYKLYLTLTFLQFPLIHPLQVLPTLLNFLYQLL